MGIMKRTDMSRLMRTPTGGGMLSTADALKKKKSMEYEVVNIPVSKLVPMEYNKEVYDVDQLDFIGATIQQYGVLQPLIVQAHENDDKYSIIAGERRYQSYMKTQSDPEHPTGTLPCKIFPAEMSETEVKIMLILTNATSRARNAETQVNELQKLIALFDEASENNIDIGFSLKELAINQLNISERQYQKYQSMFQVIEPLQEPLKSYDVNLASSIGAKPTEVQEEVYTRWQENPDRSVKDVYEEVNNEYKNFKQITKNYDAEIADLKQQLATAQAQAKTSGDSSEAKEIKEKITDVKKSKKEHKDALKDTLEHNRKEGATSSDSASTEDKKHEKDAAKTNTRSASVSPVQISVPDPFLLTKDKAMELAEVSVRALSIRSAEGTMNTIERLEVLKTQIDFVISRIKSSENVQF